MDQILNSLSDMQLYALLSSIFEDDTYNALLEENITVRVFAQNVLDRLADEINDVLESRGDRCPYLL